MAICRDCGQEMLGAESCTYPELKLGNTTVLRGTSYYDSNERCHDCGIVNKPGNIHHLGCDIERCPICGGRLISCGCWGKLGFSQLEALELK